jgi:asparagine synthetase B (glutamine-hydrolysing)
MISIIQVYGSNAIAHERLAIIDPDSGSQPLVSPDGNSTYPLAYLLDRFRGIVARLSS